MQRILFHAPTGSELQRGIGLEQRVLELEICQKRKRGMKRDGVGIPILMMLGVSLAGYGSTDPLPSGWDSYNPSFNIPNEELLGVSISIPLAQAHLVRETAKSARQRSSASLMEFLNAQSDYRQVQLAYVQLVGSYLTAAGRLDLAVGSEDIH